MKKRNLLLVLLGAVVMTSCLKDKYDFTEVKIDYSPTLALPLIEADVITKDLLAGIDTNVISTGSDNVLQVVFNDTLTSIGLDSLVSIDSKSVKDSNVVGAIAIPDESSSSVMTLNQLKTGLPADKQLAIDAAIASSTSGTPVVVDPLVSSPAGEQSIGSLSGFSSVTFSEGQMAITVTNNLTMPLDLTMDLKSGSTVIGTFNYGVIAAGANKTESVSLDQKSMTPAMVVDITAFGSPGTAPTAVFVAGTDEILFEVAMTNVKVKAGTVEIEDTEILNESTDLDLGLTDEVLTKVNFSSMSLDYDIDLGIQSNAKIYMSMPGAMKSGQAFSDSITIIRGNAASGKGSFDLSGYEVTLSGNKIQTTMRAVLLKEAGNPIAFDSADVARFTFGTSSIKIASIEGYFGSRIIDFANEEVSTGISNDELLNSIKLVSPVITMSFDNSFDIPMEFTTLNMVATGGTSEVTLTGLALPFPIKEGKNNVIETSVMTIAAPATNIDDAINAQAQKFVVGGNATINPAGNASVVNKADTASRLTVRLNVEVPMHGTIDGLIVLDTIQDLDLAQVTDNAEMVVLRSVITNEFPLDGEIQMVFVDANYVALDSLVAPNGDGKFMKAAETDANGVTTANGASVKTNDFTLKKATLAKLSTAKHLILKVKISSGNGGTDVMKILSTYNMNVKLGLIAKLQVGELLNSED